MSLNKEEISMRSAVFGAILAVYCMQAAAQDAGVYEVALRATCRVDVNPGTRVRAFGTGTFVKSPQEIEELLEENEVLVVTAGHVLESITIRGGVAVSLPSLAKDGRSSNGFNEQLQGRLLDFVCDDPNGDVGLIAVKIESSMLENGVVKLAPMHLGEMDIRVDQKVLVVGCRGSSPAKVEQARAIQYFPGNESSGPHHHLSVLRRSGDSGGGMFDLSGRLMGICSASSEEPMEMAVGFGLVGFDGQSSPRMYRGQTSVFTPCHLVKGLFKRLHK
jgi:hypothetical protein